MSVEAITWALKQTAPNASSKHLLTVLANCADAVTGLCWPSAAYLEETTQQNTKTVYINLRRLKEAGLIADSGERRGATGQIVVYRLALPTASDHGTLPKTDTKAPENGSLVPVEATRKERQSDPKSGHGNERNKTDLPAVALPAFLAPAVWQAWIDHRRAIKKPLTDYTAKLALNRLTKLVGQGHDPVRLVDEAILNCWQSFYPNASTKTTAPPGSRHLGAGRLEPVL